MSTMTFIKMEKRGKKEYAYEITSFWDKKLKTSRQKKKYLGIVIDKEKKIFKKYSRKESEKLIIDFGDTYLLEKFFEKSSLNNLIDDVFEDCSNVVRALVFYKLCYPSAMRYCQRWFEGNYAKIRFPHVNLSSQRISDFLKLIGEEELQRKFFCKYIPTFPNTQKGIIIDATSLPNQIHIPLTMWGRSGEEIDKQIRFLLVVDKESEEPLFFRHYAGNIVDVSTLHNTISELRKFGVKKTYTYLDAGFFSEDNIIELYAEKINFLTRLPSIRCLYKELIKSEIMNLESYENVVRYGKRGLFIKQKKIKLFGRKAFAHIVLDPERKGRETKNLIINVIDEKNKQDAKELEYMFKTRGVMILVSSFRMDKKEVVPAYYIRQTAEKMFGFSKDDLDFLPLGVHSEETLRGLLFLQFMSLVAFVKLKKKLGKDHTVEEFLLTMRNLKGKVYDDEIIIGEMTKQQKLLAEKLEIIVPKNLGI